MTVEPAEYDGMDNDALKDELRERGLSTSGNKDVLIGRLKQNDAEKSDDADVASADSIIDKANDIKDNNVSGDPQASGPSHLPEQADKSPLSTGAEVWPTPRESVGPDGLPLPQLHPEPADVAGPGGNEYTDDSAAVAHRAQKVADAKYHIEGLEANKGREIVYQEEANLADGVPAEGYNERTLPVANRQEEALAAWREAHPDVETIPPSLLPPAYRDPMIATPGLPGDDLVTESKPYSESYQPEALPEAEHTDTVDEPAVA